MENELALLNNYLVVGAMLFGIGAIGFLSRRNLIVIFLAAEMMLQGISLTLVAWGRYHNDFGGQMFVVFIITVAACEAAIAMALILMLSRASGSLDVVLWQRLREANQPAYVDEEVPELPVESPAWPKLAPAGHAPEPDPSETEHRPGV